MTEKEEKVVKASTLKIDPRGVGTGEGVIEGVDMVVFAKLQSEDVDGKRLVLQTDGELSEKMKTDTEVTKDGSLVNAKGLESELSCTTFVDRASDQYKWLTEAFRDKKLFDLWLVDMKSTVSVSKKSAQYFQAIISEKKDKLEADSKMEVEVTFTIQGKGKFGETDLPAGSDTLSSVDYEFKTVKKGE